MAENSNIEWTDHTFNPWRGCTKVSPGCANCYAETLSKRNPAVLGQWGPGKPRVLASEAMWQQPMKWNRAAKYMCPTCGVVDVFEHEIEPTKTFVSCDACDSTCTRVRPRVFCASLADWLDDEVPIEWLARLMELIMRTPNLDWLLLTKRPENWHGRILAALKHVESIPEDWPSRAPETKTGDMLNEWLGSNPHANVWIGATIEDQYTAGHRHRDLMAIPSKVHFWSSEPLLSDLQTKEIWAIYGAPSWVICGGESGPKARPMHPDWARSLRDQCAAAQVPFFFKQWGEWSEVDGAARTPGGNHISIDADSKSGKSLYRPLTDCLVSVDGKTFSRESLRPGIKARLMRRAHKAISGRLLDGIEHNGFPKLEGRAA